MAVDGGLQSAGMDVLGAASTTESSIGASFIKGTNSKGTCLVAAAKRDSSSVMAANKGHSVVSLTDDRDRSVSAAEPSNAACGGLAVIYAAAHAKRQRLDEPPSSVTSTAQQQQPSPTRVTFADQRQQLLSGRVAWPGGHMFVSDKRESLKALLRRKRGDISDQQRRAAARFHLTEHGLSDDEQPQSMDELSDDEQPQSQPKSLHSGSAKPHASDGQDQQYQRRQRWAPSGSLRQLEPERFEVLRDEPLPHTNVMKRTDPEDPPDRIENPPGPFTTEQLIPQETRRRVLEHGLKVRIALQRAQRGDAGVHVAKRLRPEVLILTEEETLNPCGRGFTWQKLPDVDLWDVVQPSSWPDHKPACSLDAEKFEELANATGFTDEQVVSWVKHGFPGARNMPTGVAVLGYPHAGAIKHAAAFAECAQRDIDEGFVTSGQAFPEIWPCRVDCMNVVIQGGKPRLTIDKRMKHHSKEHPEPVPSYNDYLELEAEREAVGNLNLPMVWQFSRGIAILNTCGVEILLGKFDLSAYFRMHGKQRMHVHQSGRLLESLYGADLCVNFGERDAPDHTCRASDALTFFVRKELRRLDGEYPSKAAKVLEWLTHRLGLATAAGDVEDQQFKFVLMFFFLYYVDDAGLAAINDLLFDKRGEPVFILVDGVRKQHTRALLYFEAAMGVVNYVGHKTPLKKQSAMGRQLEFLGVDLFIKELVRRLSRDKRKTYSEHVVLVLESPSMPNGAQAATRDDFNSMVHKLLHACSVVPLMRQHLFHARQAVKQCDSSEGEKVVFGAEVRKELLWCKEQLAASADEGIPMASRFDFPTGPESTLIRYTDASREPLKASSESGWGGWAIVLGVFIYAFGEWSQWEVNSFSINVLEAKAKDMFGTAAFEYADAKGVSYTHSMAFVDNSTAEHVSENGRSQSAAMQRLNLERQQFITARGFFESTERVASVDNDVADDLSRGRIDEALRVPRYAKIPVERIYISKEQRCMATLPTTWQ